MTHINRRDQELCTSQVAWVDRLPCTWHVAKAKSLFSRVQREVRPEDEVVTAFRDGQVTLRALRRPDGYTLSDKEVGYQGIRAGDLVVHQMDAFAGAIGVSEADGKSTPVYTTLIAKHPGDTDLRYYMYLLRHLASSGYILSLAKGIRERSTDFRWGDLRELTLSVPPRSEQIEISGFIDARVADIDDLVLRKQRLVDLLLEKRQALISRCALRGLSPSAPTEDTGIEWLGRVPAHWDILPLHVVFREHRRPNSAGAESNLLSLSHGRIVRKDINSTEGLLPASFDTYNIVEPGDVVLRLTDLQNDQKSLRSGLVLERGMVTSAYVTLRQTRSLLDQRYAAYLFNAYDAMKVFYAQGAGVRQTMKFSDLKRMPVVVPPRPEQDAICDALDVESTKVDALVEKTRLSIELLKEYRKALISAAVAGHLDIGVADRRGDVA